MDAKELELIIDELKSIIELGEENNHNVQSALEFEMQRLKRKFSSKLVPRSELAEILGIIIRSKSQTEVEEIAEKYSNEWDYDKQACFQLASIVLKKYEKEKWN